MPVYIGGENQSTVGTSVDSSEIADGSIVNADVNASAAIAYSKLNLTGAVLTEDLEPDIIATGALIADNAVDSEHITAGAIDVGHLAADAVDSDALDFALEKDMVFEYDFADLGGLVSTITLTDISDGAQNLPDNAVITDAWVEAITTCTSSGSATIQLGTAQNTNAFLPAVAYNNGEFTAGAITVSGNELPEKNTAARAVQVIIGTAALTAGKFRVHVTYKEGA